MGSCSLSMILPDEELVRRFRLGEPEAFSLLYRRYRRPVLATARRILRDGEDARDAAQEIFLKLYLALGDWDPGKSRLSTWLYRLATNHALDCWRLRRRRPHSAGAREEPDFPTEVESLASRDPDPLCTVLRRERARRLLRRASRLPRRQRRVFVLHYLRGLSLREIATEEECPVNTVKGLLFRAVRSIRSRGPGRLSSLPLRRAACFTPSQAA